MSKAQYSYRRPCIATASVHAAMNVCTENLAERISHFSCGADLGAIHVGGAGDVEPSRCVQIDGRSGEIDLCYRHNLNLAVVEQNVIGWHRVQSRRHIPTIRPVVLTKGGGS